MQVKCTKGQWITMEGKDKEYPWISGRQTFYRRNLKKPRFVRLAETCYEHEDMRDNPNEINSCCNCLNCKLIGGYDESSAI